MTNATPICFLDTETDGIHPGRKAWEIALIRREPDGREETRAFFVSIDLSTADRFGLRVGRFYDRHPAGRYTATGDTVFRAPGGYDLSPSDARQAAQTVARMTHGATLVGAVPSFDAEVFDRLLRENGLCPAWDHRLRCVETLTAGFLRRDVGGLAACAAALTLENPAQHTALGDAQTARAIWDRVVAP